MQTNEKLSQEEGNNIIALGKKLIGLGIKAQFSHTERGPIVTAYFFALDASESIKRVMNKSEDLALALEADKVQMQRIGGKIALFVPNQNREVVDFKTYLNWYLHDEEVKKQEIPIGLGVDYRGKRSTLDLTEAPHLLITGTTGSGKSVWLSSILTELGYFFSPKELFMYLCDTKKVDLPLFADLPHVKVMADDVFKFHNMMGDLMQEARRRLTVLQGVSCRKIQDYHKMMGGRESMPYIIAVLDEFGDLGDLDKAIRQSGDSLDEVPTVKQWIKSATQIWRAAGLHLICGTQRSSVKVVDGDIKSNLPCRISLYLPTGTDSRTILGVNGAESLLGKGDMLVKRPERDTLERFHGPFVSMNDIAELIGQYDYLKDILSHR